MYVYKHLGLSVSYVRNYNSYTDYCTDTKLFTLTTLLVILAMCRLA